jgi:hypothetical protein
MPAWLFAAVLIVTIYFVPAARAVDGSHVTTLTIPSQENEPDIFGEPVMADCVAFSSIATEKVITMLAFTETPTELFAGFVPIMVGVGGGMVVVKTSEYWDSRFAPSALFAAVVTFIAYFVPGRRLDCGVRVRLVSPENHDAVHVIDGFAPIAPSVSVLFIALLNLMVIEDEIETFAELFAGYVAVTVGAWTV